MTHHSTWHTECITTSTIYNFKYLRYTACISMIHKYVYIYDTHQSIDHQHLYDTLYLSNTSYLYDTLNTLLYLRHTSISISMIHNNPLIINIIDTHQCIIDIIDLWYMYHTSTIHNNPLIINTTPLVQENISQKRKSSVVDVYYEWERELKS
jgi:hypothetical protein